MSTSLLLKQRVALFTALATHNPNPKTELIYQSEFELLIAVLLSAQATDLAVNRATAALFVVANTPEKMLALGEAKITEYIRTIGLFKTKARHIVATCTLLIQQHNSQVPNDRGALEALPGVGRKTANVLLNTLFQQPVIAVDTHIFRVANRTGLAHGKTVGAVENGLLQHIPQKFIPNAHHWLVLHGRYVCKARTPLCSDCVIRNFCAYKAKNI